jgi:zinc protease
MDLDRSQVPEAGPVRPFDFPEVATQDLPSGLAFRVARSTRFPLVTVSLLLDAGEALLPSSRAGHAVLTGSSLEGGTRNRTGPELAEALEGIGAGLSVSTGWDATAVTLTCVAERLPEAMGLLAEAVLEPAFPPEEVERLRDQRLAAIKQRRMDPGSLAEDSSVRFFFGPEVPYHRPLAGAPGSVEGFGPEDARAFTAARFKPGGAGLVVVGDVEPSEIETLTQRTFGSWSGAADEEGEFDSVPLQSENKIVIVDRPGAVQSEIRIGQVGAAHSSPHFFPLQVFNAVLGGAFTSRLMLNLREKQGFTYGIRSRFAFRRKAGPFAISTAVATEVTAQAVRETMRELVGLLDEGPTEDEAARARDYIAGVFPLRLETTSQVAARIGELLVYDLPDDFHSTYRDRIRAVTPEAALEAGRAVLRPSEMVAIVVGDTKEIRGPLEELSMGPVELASPF